MFVLPSDGWISRRGGGALGALLCMGAPAVHCTAMQPPMQSNPFDGRALQAMHGWPTNPFSETPNPKALPGGGSAPPSSGTPNPSSGTPNTCEAWEACEARGTHVNQLRPNSLTRLEPLFQGLWCPWGGPAPTGAPSSSLRPNGLWGGVVCAPPPSNPCAPSCRTAGPSVRRSQRTVGPVGRSGEQCGVSMG